ncbi:response regulator transcription factor [Streptomyces montanus]|nr:response regulator transcription factor [Streptomyces montanus]
MRRPNTPAAWSVLIADSDRAEAQSLALGLRRHGHTVDVVQTGAAALQAYGSADLVILDLELPDMDGLEVCRKIRSACAVPIIAVTARSSELDCVLGLQAGADHYLPKPYGFRELVARTEAVMRRARPKPPAPRAISRGPLRIDAARREVSLEGRRIEVTPKEFDLLYLLASNPDAIVPRHQLIQQVWGNSWSRRTVDTHVSSLRGKLGAGDWIITIRGVGFRLGRA